MLITNRTKNLLWNSWIYFLIIFLNVIIGSWNVYSKYCVHFFSPMVVVGFRFIFGTPLIFFITAFVGNKFPKFKGTKDILTFFIAGTIMYISQLLYIIGLGYTSVSNGSILMLGIPVITAILSMILRIDGFHYQKILGLIVCSIGSLLILSTAGFNWNDTMKGNILVILSGFCFSIYVLFMQRRLLPRYKPLIVTSWCFFFGMKRTIPAFVLTVLFLDYSAIFDVPLLVWVSFAYGAVIVTAIGNLLYNWCLSKSSPVKVTSFMVIQPVTATILAAFLLHEQILPLDLIGGGIITGGLILVLYAQEKRNAQIRKKQKEIEKKKVIENMNAIAEEKEHEIEMQNLAKNLNGIVQEFELKSETDANLESDLVLKEKFDEEENIELSLISNSNPSLKEVHIEPVDVIIELEEEHFNPDLI